MILGITDAKGLTNRVSDLRRKNKGKEVQHLYRRLFELHQSVLDAHTKCAWVTVKTTGDGLMFFSDSAPDREHLKTLPALQRAVADGVAEGKVKIRAIACHLEPKGVVHADQIQYHNGGKTFPWLRNDLFGHELNKAFRLLSAVSEDAAIVEQSLMEAIFQKEKGQKEKVHAKEGFGDPASGLRFTTPVPVTFLKGISDVGFSSEKGKKPHWLWEIIQP